jgi:Fe-S cluster biogenesis protein NfuA
MTAVDEETLKQRVADVLAREAGPALGMDGALLEVLGVEDRIARIRLRGACGTCPSSIAAVVHLLEDLLRRHLPQVRYVEVTP